MDLASGTFRVPQRRVESLQQALRGIVGGGLTTSARSLSHLIGFLESMSLALGPVVRLWIRGLYREILQAPSGDRVFLLSTEAQEEILFWTENVDNSGYPMWCPSPKIEVLTYSDAIRCYAYSGGWGGFAVEIGKYAAMGSWSEVES